MVDIKYLIDQANLNKIAHEVDGIYYFLDPCWKKISISVSGGADSALLSYLLCNKISSMGLGIEVHIISNIRMWKTRPWQRYNSLDVYNWLKEKFKKINFYRHENFIAPEIEYGSAGPTITTRNGNKKSGDQISTQSFAEYVCVTNNINAWFAGITKNPPTDFSVQGMPDRNLENALSLEDIFFYKNGIWVCHPFRFTTKDRIVKQYIDHNILDLFDLTRSCEGDFDFLDYKNYAPGNFVPECGECFWCKERNWAKQQNGL